MFYTLRREYYCPQMAGDVLSTVRSCRSCTRLPGTHFKDQKLIKLFRAAGSRCFFAMDLVGQLKKTAPGNTLILVMNDQFTEMKRYIPLWNTTAAAVAAAFLRI